MACADAGAVSIHGVALHLRGAVRGHYLEWLQGERPDLVRLHRERFRRGAYQEDAERERVEGIVRAAALRCGVTGRDRYRSRPEVTGPEGGPGPEGGQQLRLLRGGGAPSGRPLLPMIVHSCLARDGRRGGSAAVPLWAW